MSSIKAAQSGDWSSTSTWSGGVIPGSADDVYANTFTVNIDQDITVNSLKNAALAGISAISGGGFTVTAGGIDVVIQQGIQISADHGAAVPIITFSHSSGTSTVTASANGFSAGTTNNYDALAVTGVGAVVANGDFPSGTIRGYGLRNDSSASVVINGNVGASSSVQDRNVSNNSTGTITINGNVTGFSQGRAVQNTSSGVVIVNGVVTGGSGNTGYGVWNSSTGSITVTGSSVGGTGGNMHGVRNSSSGTVVINGDAVGGTSTGTGVSNESTGRVTVTGDVLATATGSGVNNSSTGGVRIGTSGQLSTITNVGTIPAVNGPWMGVVGAAIAFVMPTDSAFPAYTGTNVTLSTKVHTLGDGAILLSDIADVVGSQLAAAISA